MIQTNICGFVTYVDEKSTVSTLHISFFIFFFKEKFQLWTFMTIFL